MPDRFAKWNADPLTREIFNPSYRAAGAYNAFRPKSWRMVDKFVPYETVETEPVPPGELDRVTTPPIPGYSDMAMNKERSNVLRELCVASALCRLGDPDGSARRSLAAYLNDPRRIYANFARRVLYGVRKAAEAVKPISDRNTDSGFANQNQICYNTDNKRESFVNTVPCDVCCAGGWWR